MEVLEAVKDRRSIRRYKTDPVEEDKLNQILEAARWAPSWHNSQCWRFIVVRDNAVKAALANTLLPVEINNARADNPAIEAVKSAPLVIVACAEVGKSGYEFGQASTDKGDYWYMYDVALAMQNLSLVAHSLGLGTVVTGAIDSQRIAGILGIPSGFCAVAMTPLGYRDQEPKPRPRKELAEIVFYGRFGTAK